MIDEETLKALESVVEAAHEVIEASSGMMTNPRMKKALEELERAMVDCSLREWDYDRDKLS